MAGISSKAAGTIQNKEKTFQGQRFDDDLGINYLSFKWRNHDPQVGRFFCVDPLASKYEYLTPYQFSSNNPITMRELEGLEGVKHDEVDPTTGKLIRHVVEKNVVVLKEPTNDKFSKRKNANIEKRNNAKIEEVKTELNEYYNGNGGKGLKNSANETVLYKFTVIGIDDFSNKGLTKKERNANYQNIGLDNGIPAKGQFGDVVAPADVITKENSGGDIGETVNNVTRLNANAPQGKYAHELLHGFGPRDNDYSSGGLKNNPPAYISIHENDEVLNACYDKK